MLKSIFGNKTAEKIFLFLFHHSNGHASAISKDFDLSLTAVLQQLNKFENCGILVSTLIGRSRVYSFNPKSPFVPPLKELIKIVYDNIPLKEKEILFKRRRPRAKGKPIR